MRSQIKIFSQYVKDYMAPPLVVLQADAKVSDLVDRMAHSAASSALIVTHDHRLNGIVTGSDVIKRVALRCEADTPVTAVMSSPVRSVRGSDHLFHALRRMHQYNLDKLPVVDSARRPIGIIRLSDVLSATVEPILSYGSTDGDEEGTGGLKRIKESQVDLADQLLRDGMPATEVQLLLSQINRYIHKEVLETALAKMEDGGWGHPPVPFAAIIMGSGGRSESFLNPDQDNGFILGDYADDRHGRIDPYFIELAEQVTLGLDEIGFPLCDGYIMATNAGWRKTLPQWQEQLAYWRRTPSLIIIRLRCELWKGKSSLPKGNACGGIITARCCSRSVWSPQRRKARSGTRRRAQSQILRHDPIDSVGPAPGASRRNRGNLYVSAFRPFEFTWKC